MLKIIAIAVIILLVALLVYAATRPDTFRVERAASVKAQPTKIFAFINDLHAWTEWSPYEKKDPAMKRTFNGVTSGKGATYAWEGNREAGQGSMEITDTSPPSKVIIKLDFVKPFEAHNTVEFTLQPQGGGTNVSWAMYGPDPYLGKLMGLFFNRDRMIGNDFEAGLASLKAIAER